MDYFTKNYPASYHRVMQSIYILSYDTHIDIIQRGFVIYVRENPREKVTHKTKLVTWKPKLITRIYKLIEQRDNSTLKVIISKKVTSKFHLTTNTYEGPITC